MPSLPPPVRRVLELRLGGAQAAVKKIDALLARAGDDDRVRGAFRYHGASTGRWAGEGFQPQNLKRPAVEDLDAAIAAVATGDYEHVRKLYPRPLSVVGDCSRSMIIAAPGHVLIGADFSSIESRVLAWVAGEEWKLDSYRRFDATRDPRDEPYCVTACKIFRVPSGTYTKKSPERERRQDLRSGVWLYGRPRCLAEIRAGSFHDAGSRSNSRPSGVPHIRRSNASGTTLIARPGLPCASAAASSAAAVSHSNAPAPSCS